MARWQVTEIVAVNERGYKLGNVIGNYPNKTAMFDAMLTRYGIGGEFDCFSCYASYRYKITQYGFRRIRGETSGTRPA